MVNNGSGGYMMLRLIPLILMLILTACASTGQILKRSEANFREGNYTEAFEQLRPLAEKDNADAQYAIGYMYYYGKGTEKDIIQAQKWIRHAANQGQPQAIKAMSLLTKNSNNENTLINYPDALNIGQ